MIDVPVKFEHETMLEIVTGQGKGRMRIKHPAYALYSFEEKEITIHNLLVVNHKNERISVLNFVHPAQIDALIPEIMASKSFKLLQS
jgi:hypothetical protein